MELVIGGQYEVDDLLPDGGKVFLGEILENVEVVVRKDRKGLGDVVVLKRTLVIVADGQGRPDGSQEGIGESRVF